MNEALRQIRNLGWQGVAIWQVEDVVEMGTWDGFLLPTTELGQNMEVRVYAETALSYRRNSAEEALQALVELAGELHDEAVQRGG